MERGAAYRTVTATLERVNAEHGCRWVLVGALSGGLQGGVHELRAPDGRRAVLKVTTDAGWAAQIDRAAPLIEVIRASGYPTPRWLLSGTTPDGGRYVVQDRVDGVAVRWSQPDLAALLHTLLERHRELNPDPGRNWSDFARSGVFGDRADAVRASGREGASVVDAFRRRISALEGTQLPTGDLVHGDFTNGNVLVSESRITGVVDIEALGSGTRVLDYATVLRSAWTEGAPYALTRELTEGARSTAGADVLAICAASVSFDLLLFWLDRDGSVVPKLARQLVRFADDLLDA